MDFRLQKYISKILIMIVLLLSGVAGIAQQSKTYDEAIIMGDKFFSDQEFLDAKAYYQKALSFKMQDEYAKSQISKIIAEMSSQMEREERYLVIIDRADELFDKNKFDEALDEYAKALAVISDDDYAQNKIIKIKDIQTNQKEKLETFNILIFDGKKFLEENKYTEAIIDFKKAQKVFPDNKEPETLILEAKDLKAEYDAKLEIYTEEVELANRYISIKNYVEALDHLNKAITIFPDNWVVENEIKKYQPLAAKQQEYNTKVEKADELYVNKNYASAKEMYLQASVLWSENSYTTDMVDRIDERLNLQMADLDGNYNKSIQSADSLFNSDELISARSEYNFSLSLKPNEVYPKDKLREIETIFEGRREELVAEYESIVKSGDSLFADENFNGAKTKYELALTIKPEDKYPANQLVEIERQLLAIAALNKLQSQYDAVIADADAYVTAKKYENAIGKYREAISIKIDEEYPAARIAEIEVVIANAAQQKEIDENYARQIALAQRLFSDNNLNDARSTYLVASELKPLEEMPKSEIAKIDNILQQREIQKNIDIQYQASINEGDSLQKLKLFDASIVAYTAALTTKPGDAFATNKLKTAQSQKVKHEKAIATLHAYESSIKKADELFADKKYSESILAYEKASGIKANEIYPKNKVNEINAILARLAAENTRKYNEAIVKADNHFDASNLSESIIQYKIASSLKPDENYPKERIAESNSLIEEKLRLVRNKYNLAIAEADKLYATKIYDKAIAAYQKADKIFPEENYPEERIAKILKLIEENAITDVVSQNLTINSGTTKTLNFEPIRINVRKSNYIFVKATNLSGDSFKIIFGYGSDKGKNGGFMVQVPEGNEQNDYIIRVGNQYKWFSEDNNWISVYPENGDIEISLLRISKSD